MKASNDISAKGVIDVIEASLRNCIKPIQLHEPSFTELDWTNLRLCLDSGFVSSIGEFVTDFETQLKRITGLHAVAVVNGTAALHIALKLAGVAVGDEVLMQPVTFVATANAVSYLGAFPNFVNCDETNLGIHPQKLRRYLQRISQSSGGMIINKITNRPLKALVCMHTFGLPSHMDELSEVCQEFGLKLVEDAAQALGSKYKGFHVGGHGDFSTISFNGNKIITTGGGGAILTKDLKLAEEAKHLTTTARVKHQFEVAHDEIGFNYRMPNLNAALGCAQIAKLDELITKKRNLFSHYEECFSEQKQITMLKENQDTESNYWLSSILLSEKILPQKDEILSALAEKGINCRPSWRPLHQLEMYKRCAKDDLEETEMISNRVISLPSSAFLCTK